MFDHTECKVMLGAFLGVVLLAEGILIACKTRMIVCVGVFLALLFLFVLSEIMILVIYQRVMQLRLAAEKIKETHETVTADLPGLYQEGEIGKLAESLDAILRQFEESGNKDKKQKEYLMNMLSDISHQLKTPIASLTVFTDILLRNVEEEKTGSRDEKAVLTVEKKQEILHEEEKQLERMKWLTYSILQLARVEAGAVTYDTKEVRLYDFCQVIVNHFHMLAEKKQIRLRAEGDENATVVMDPDWMQEAVGNIVKNAIDYSKDGGTVTLSISKTPIATRLFVEDDGCGIREADQLNIFRRFYRVNGSAVNPSSVGIGLALSKSIIEDCGGRLYVESRHESECSRNESSYTKMIIILPDAAKTERKLTEI